MADNLIYFLSFNNDRSLMAEGWASKLKLTDWHFESGGWFFAERNPLSIEAMKEINIDLSQKLPKKVDLKALEEASLIVAIYDFDQEIEIPLPDTQKHKLIQWDIKNPSQYSQEDIDQWVLYQEICDEIALKVKSLEQTLPTYH